MAYYKTGTISCTSGNSAVTGSGTAFIANVKAGDALVVAGATYEITAVNSDTSLTISPNYAGSTQSGLAYMIMPVHGYMKQLATDVATLISNYGGFYNSGSGTVTINYLSTGAGTVSLPSVLYTSDPDTGFYWSAANELSVAAGGTRSASFTSTGINNTAIGATTPSTGAFTTLTTTGQLTVGGNLVVNGTTTTVNSTTQTLDDPVLTLGGDTAPTVDDNKDRGIEFRWHSGTAAKIGFFGYDDSTGKFVFIPDASNTSEVFSGTAGPAVFGALEVTTLANSGVHTATGGQVVFDNNWSMKDNSDNTKVIQWQLSSLTTATTRTYTAPDLDGTMALSGSGSTNCPRNADLGGAAYLDEAVVSRTAAPVTVAAATYTVTSSDRHLIISYAGTCTLTLGTATAGRELTIKTITANAVNSASSNVAPLTDSTAGTAVLAATDGKWVDLVGDGTNWIAMRGN